MLETASNDFKNITINNVWTQKEVDNAFKIIVNSGVQCENSLKELNVKFDIVDLKFLEKNADGAVVSALTKELQKIKSYSTNNGKMVYASFNKDKKVANKKQNSKARLAYESYKKDFDTHTNEFGGLNQIYCADKFGIFAKNA